MVTPNPFSVFLKVLSLIVRSKSTRKEVDRELNEHFDGFEKDITTYNGTDITIEFESINVRPMYGGKVIAKGVRRLENPVGFSQHSSDRESPSFVERFSAVMNGEWISEIQFNIRGGSIKDIRPEGINLSYITTRLGIAQSGREIKVADTSEVQSDKLKMKILYRDDIGEFRQEISDVIDLLVYVQNHMEEQAILCLLDLYHASPSKDNPDSPWRNEEMAMKLGEFVLDESVDPYVLADSIDKVKENIEDSIDSSDIQT